MFKGATVIKTFPYNKIGSWGRGDPFAVVFVYPRSNKRALHVFKGSWKTIEEKIVEYGLRPCIVYADFHCRGQKRTVARVLYNERNSDYNIYLSKDCYKDNKGFHRKHWHLIVFDRKNPCMVLERRFRRPPRNWLKELDKYV